jgi:hypothetical protein
LRQIARHSLANETEWRPFSAAVGALSSFRSFGEADGGVDVPHIDVIDRPALFEFAGDVLERV